MLYNLNSVYIYIYKERERCSYTSQARAYFATIWANNSFYFIYFLMTRAKKFKCPLTRTNMPVIPQTDHDQCYQKVSFNCLGNNTFKITNLSAYPRKIIVYSWSTINAYSLLLHEWWILLIKFMVGHIIYVRGGSTHLWYSGST